MAMPAGADKSPAHLQVPMRCGQLGNRAPCPPHLFGTTKTCRIPVPASRSGALDRSATQQQRWYRYPPNEGHGISDTTRDHSQTAPTLLKTAAR